MEEEGIRRNAAAPAIPVAAVEEGGVIVNAGEEEISDDIYYLRPEDAGIILSHTDPGRMKITRQEHRLALAIREAIAAAPDIDPISDMMCAQLAMIEGENIEAALERAEQLQAFREEYGVQDTAEDGIRSFTRLNSLFPCFHLCISYNHDGGNYVMIYDMTKFDLRLLKTEEQINIWLGGSYYSQAALFPDLEAIRRGAILINELEGYDWKVNLNFKVLKRVWTEVAAVYPCRFERFKFFNAGTTFNIVNSMIRQFLPEHAREAIEIGCQFEERLDRLYLVPTIEEANQRLLDRVSNSLDRRYENEMLFKL